MNKIKKYRLVLLLIIILDLVWSASALVYDWPAMMRIPVYYWLLIIICPVYPFLLAIVWWRLYRSQKINQLLLAFAAVPSVIYFLAALIYYPTWMVKNDFDWLALGQIFWVAFYGVQGWILLKKQPTSTSAVGLVCVFLVISFAVQYRNNTFDYLDVANLGQSLMLAEYFVLSLLTVGLFFLLKFRRR